MMSLSVARRIQRAAQPTTRYPFREHQPTCSFLKSGADQGPHDCGPVPAFRELAYDYTNQAWIVNGVYQSCGHPKPCTCFGTVHAGEKPQADADIH